MFSELMEILIFAAIAGFLAFKLYITLGSKTGFERPPQAHPIRPEEAIRPNKEEPLEEVVEEILDPALKEGFEKLKSYMPNFRISDFLKRATHAFELILEAFAKGDLATLQTLLGPVLYEEFKTTIEERQRDQEVLETTLVKIESVKLRAMDVQGKIAHLTVDFQTEQIHITRDQQGNIVDGDPKQIEQLFDSWTFEKDISRSNPMWILVKTET